MKSEIFLYVQYVIKSKCFISLFLNFGDLCIEICRNVLKRYI